MKTAIACLALVLVAACGGGDGGSEGGKSFGSGQEVADATGCTGFTNDSEEMFVTEGGSCELDGETIYVHYFRNDDLRKNWQDVAGGMSGDPILAGEGWTVSGPQAVLETVKAKIGGEIS